MTTKVSCRELLIRANSALVRRRRSTGPEWIDFMILLSSRMWHTSLLDQTRSNLRSAAGKRRRISDLRQASARHEAGVVKALDRRRREQAQQFVMHMGRRERSDERQRD